jgi:hypothetical protein
MKHTVTVKDTFLLDTCERKIPSKVLGPVTDQGMRESHKPLELLTDTERRRLQMCLSESVKAKCKYVMEKSGHVIKEVNVLYFVPRHCQYGDDNTKKWSLYVWKTMCCISLQVPVKVRLVAGAAWGHGPCIVSKVGVPLSDTVYYYRHIFTVIGSVIIIFLAAFYGNTLQAPTCREFNAHVGTLETVKSGLK